VKIIKARGEGDRRTSIGISSEEIKSVSCVNDPVATAPGSDFYRPLRGLNYLLGAWYLGLTPQALCFRLLRRLDDVGFMLTSAPRNILLAGVLVRGLK